jgi:hypothetical protein
LTLPAASACTAPSHARKSSVSFQQWTNDAGGVLEPHARRECTASGLSLYFSRRHRQLAEHLAGRSVWRLRGQGCAYAPLFSPRRRSAAPIFLPWGTPWSLDISVSRVVTPPPPPTPPAQAFRQAGRKLFSRQVGEPVLGSDGTIVGQNHGCDRMLRCGAPFFCAEPVPYVNTCVHTKFEANPCTWAPSRTVDVSRFRVGRRAATAGGDRVAAARRPPPRGGHRLPNSCAPPNLLVVARSAT